MATSTSVSSSLTDVPDILKPYITDKGGVLPTAAAITGKNYDEMYGNALNKAGLSGAGRVASLSPFQTDLGKDLKAMNVPSEFDQGTGAVNRGLTSLGQATDAYGNLGTVQNQALTNYQMAGPEKYTGDQVSQYMSPYMQQVVDVQKQAALRDAQMKLVGSNLASSRQGTYGGARNALMQSEADRNLQTQMGNIQATGSQNAFQNAQQQFNTWQQANQAANQANLNANLSVQQLGSAQSLEAQKANQARDLARAQGYGNLATTYNQAGSTFGALGTGKEAATMDILKARGAYGDLERGVQQQGLDAQYADLMAKLNQPLTNVETMNNLARGVPLTQTGTSTTNTTPPPSFASQLAGMGLTGLSLYNMYNKP
jgi:hypothetical protein